MNIISRKDARSQGLSHYFTGKQCKHGHLSKMNTKSGKCLECDNVRNSQYRKDNPETMVEWRKKNPRYASEKYHENKEDRIIQSKDWYENNKERALRNHKEWYYDSTNQESIIKSRKEWYKNNPDYDRQYYYDNHEHFINDLTPKQRERYYAKRRKIVQERFTELAIISTLPSNPTERDFKYWLAGEIIIRTDWEVFKEVYIDKNNTSRIDLLIPSKNIGIELKINNMYGNSIATDKQIIRYKKHLPNYNILLVSLDGSVGMTPEQLFDGLKLLY